MSVLRAKDFTFAFSLNKQSAIGTGITPAQINKALPQRTFAPTTAEFPDQVSDKAWYGKGHSFPTFKDNIDQRIVVGSREYSMTQLSALFAPAFVLGSLVSTQPSSGPAPTIFDHSFTFQNPSTNPNCLFTSFLEKMGGEYQNLVSGAVINSMTVKAERNDHVVLGWEGFARKIATNATVLPAIATGQSFFKLLKADIRFGASGGSYATNISTEVLSLNFMMTQNAKGWWLPGAASGEEALLSKALIGDQSASGSLVLFIDNARRNLFINDTEVEIKIRFMGDQIGTSGLFHEVELTLPHVKASAEGFSEIDSTTAYTFTFSDATILKGATDPYLVWKVRTNVNTAELLVAA
jgi:hypothetical protein